MITRWYVCGESCNVISDVTALKWGGVLWWCRTYGSLWLWSWLRYSACLYWTTSKSFTSRWNTEQYESWLSRLRLFQSRFYVIEAHHRVSGLWCHWWRWLAHPESLYSNFRIALKDFQDLNFEQKDLYIFWNLAPTVTLIKHDIKDKKLTCWSLTHCLLS